MSEKKDFVSDGTTCYVVRRNSDTCEGRGPMVLDSVWAEEARPECAAYIDAQIGVMGRRDKWSEMEHGDWEMERVPLFNSRMKKDMRDEAVLREKALAKLTNAEKRALGLE